MKISTRLLLIVATCLLPILGLYAVVSWQQWSDRRRTLDTLAVQQARLLAGDVDSIVNGARILLGAAAQFRQVRILGEGCSDRLEAVLSAAPGFAFIAMVDPTGEVRCASDPALRSGQTDFTWATDARLADGFAAGRFARMPFLPSGFLPFYMAMDEATAARGHRLVAALDLRWLEAHLQGLKRSGSPFLADGVLTVADADGVILGRDARHADFVGRRFPAEALGLLSQVTPGVLRLRSIDGTDRLVGYVPPTGLNHKLAAVVGFHEPDLMADVGRSLRYGALLLGLACLVAVGATLLVARLFIARPTGALLGVARQWREGDLSVRVPAADNGAEFAQIGAAFNEMAKAVQGREEMLRAQAEALEATVAQRTRDLVLANERLHAEIAERRGTEAALLQAQKVQAVGQLAGGIAHDFNNVLQAVLGGVALIRRRAADSAQVLHLAGMVEDAARRGESVTRRLLAFSRREELRSETLDVAALLRGLQEVLSATLGSRIRVEVAAPQGLPPVLADRGQLETVLVNLATNARDAMRGGGVLTLAAEEQAHAAAGPAAGLAPGAYVRITVSDTGEGMSDEVLARAAEPFFTTKPLGQGTGLGLAMARSFAQGSRGTLTIASAPGEGTHVSLWLPVVAAAADASAVPPCRTGAAGTGQGPSYRVLLVDDDDAVRQVVAAELEDAGFQVTHTSNGAAALALLDRDASFDVLVSDLAMPGLDGVATIREAQHRDPGLPAVLVTGYVDKATALASEAPSGRGFTLLRKPIDGTTLAQEVERLARRRRPVAATAG
jgi:signal transduction histidine kinase/CheY-like chemotaxis protein